MTPTEIIDIVKEYQTTDSMSQKKLCLTLYGRELTWCDEPYELK